MRYFCVDYGSKRIGTAVSNAEGTIAFPRTTVPNNQSAIAAIVEMIAAEKAEALVFGDTRTLEGGENPVTVEAESFAAKLGDAARITVAFAREAGSSRGASEEAGGHDDAAAAAFILQRYLDMHTRRVE